LGGKKSPRLTNKTNGKKTWKKLVRRHVPPKGRPEYEKGLKDGGHEQNLTG